MDVYEGRAMSTSEEDEFYGKRKNSIGLCFKCDTHYYKQCKEYVLHVNGTIINTLHVGALNPKLDKGLEIIDIDIFDKKIKEAIYEMDLYKYWDIDK